MEHHDIGCTLFSLCSAMRTQGYTATARNYLSAVKRNDVCDYGLIWKGTCLPVVIATMM